MTIAESNFVLVDTETTHREPEHAELLEVAARRLDGSLRLVDRFVSLCRPTKPIPPAASAVHHLVDGDFSDAPERAAVEDALSAFLPSDAALVAHNADYDRALLGDRFAAFRWICTERMARHLVPDAPEFKNATLYYWFGGPKITRALHGADADLDVTEFNFRELLARYRVYAAETCGGDAERLAKSEDLDTMLAFFARPYVMTHWPNFGKWRGAPMDDIPTDYFEWALSSRGLTDCDDDLRWNLERQMRRRGVAT
ncbi:MAG: exoX [Candidatus Eremiobacteraeota bacterium]|nr:exoX [Candidatus Eremiobacteraeota bacterium]